MLVAVASTDQLVSGRALLTKSDFERLVSAGVDPVVSSSQQLVASVVAERPGLQAALVGQRQDCSLCLPEVSSCGGLTVRRTSTFDVTSSSSVSVHSFQKGLVDGAIQRLGSIGSSEVLRDEAGSLDMSLPMTSKQESETCIKNRTGRVDLCKELTKQERDTCDKKPTRMSHLEQTALVLGPDSRSLVDRPSLVDSYRMRTCDKKSREEPPGEQRAFLSTVGHLGDGH